MLGHLLWQAYYFCCCLALAKAESCGDPLLHAHGGSWQSVAGCAVEVVSCGVAADAADADCYERTVAAAADTEDSHTFEL